MVSESETDSEERPQMTTRATDKRESREPAADTKDKGTDRASKVIRTDEIIDPVLITLSVLGESFATLQSAQYPAPFAPRLSKPTVRTTSPGTVSSETKTNDVL